MTNADVDDGGRAAHGSRITLGEIVDYSPEYLNVLS